MYLPDTQTVTFQIQGLFFIKHMKILKLNLETLTSEHFRLPKEISYIKKVKVSRILSFCKKKCCPKTFIQTSPHPKAVSVSVGKLFLNVQNIHRLFCIRYTKRNKSAIPRKEKRQVTPHNGTQKKQGILGVFVVLGKTLNTTFPAAAQVHSSNMRRLAHVKL